MRMVNGSQFLNRSKSNQTSMFKHRFQKRVRYGETDQMGYLYYGNYAQLYEIGRVEMIRSLGLTYKMLEEEYKVMMPVLNMHSRFVRPAFYDELLTIETQLRSLPGREITFHHEIFNEKKKLVNGGKVTLIFVDIKTNKRIDTPVFLLQKFKPYFEI